MTTKLTFLMALPLLSSLACGGKSDAEKFADDFCAEVSKCCGQQGLPSDGKTCRMWMSMGQGYNASAGEACLAEVRAQVSAGTFCQDTTSDQSPCDSVYSNASTTGDKKPGDSCNTDSDCAKSSEGQVACTGTSLDNTVCQVRVAGKAGEACVGTQEGDTYYGNGGDDISTRVTVCNVSDGLRCSESACVALTAVGGSCYSSNDCVRSTYCDGSLDKCVAKISNGGACAYTNDCVAGSYCNSSKVCTSQLANGATCSASEMCLSWYCDDTVCTDLGSAIATGLGLKLLCSEF